MLRISEMAMQNYCGVGNFLEHIATNSSDNTISIGDISGFGIELAQHKKSLLELALEAKDIITSCLTELQQKDELIGVASHASALSLRQSMTNLNSVHESHNDEAYPKLLDLDVELQNRNSAVNASMDFGRVVTCLEDLGLEHVKQTYMKGVSSHNNVPFGEKWFEDALLRTSQWDDSLLKPSDNVFSSVSTHSALSATPMPTSDLLTPSLEVSPGYNEAVYHALQSLVRVDLSGCKSAVSRAREAILRDMSSQCGSDVKLSIPSHLLKLSICDSLTAASQTIEGTTSVDCTIKRWGFANGSTLQSLLLGHDELSLETSEHTPTCGVNFFRLNRLESSVKEVLLSLFYKNFPQNRESTVGALSAHIFRSSRMYRDVGRLDAAKQGICRLRDVLQLFDEPPSVIPLALRLEDAKIMAFQNDFGNAITHCKTIVNHLSDNKSDNTSSNDLLAQSLLLGGCFMAHEHVDAVETMEQFFERAAKLSHQAHQSHSHSLSSAVAYFKLGEFASGIYSSIDARVCSESWSERKVSLVEREKQLATLQLEYSPMEKKFKRSKKQADADAFNKLARNIHELSKEIGMEQREINSTHDNLQKYLR